MAGFDFVIQGTEAEALEAVRTAAQAEQFEVVQEADGRFAAKKGSLPMSIFLGAFIAYCDFKFTTAPAGSGLVKLGMQRNNPWWTGLIGINRVKNAATRYADGIEKTLGPRLKSKTPVA